MLCKMMNEQNRIQETGYQKIKIIGNRIHEREPKKE